MYAVVVVPGDGVVLEAGQVTDLDRLCAAMDANLAALREIRETLEAYNAQQAVQIRQALALMARVRELTP